MTDYKLRNLVATDTIWDAAGDLAVGTGANTAGRLALGGALALPRVNAAGNAIEWGTGGQIAFPADVAASADANTLDDYEEGYLTPVTVVCSTSGSYTVDTNNDTLAYRKIGSLVHVQGHLNITGETSPSGTLRFLLPFTSAALDENSDRASGVVALGGHGGTVAGKTTALVISGTAYFIIYTMADNGTDATITNANVDTAFVIEVTLSYIAA